MEKWKVVGFRKVNFKDQQQRQITGCSLFLARPGQDDKTVGLEVQKLFIGSNVEYEPKENDKIEIFFNRYGKVAAIEVLG